MMFLLLIIISNFKHARASLTVIADGCFSKFRKDFNPLTVKVSSQFVGTILHNCPQYKSGHAEIVLSSHGPILIYQISTNDTRILVDVQGKLPTDITTFMKDKILPELPGKNDVIINYTELIYVNLIQMALKDHLKMP